MSLSVERKKVMLTHRIERNITYQDHLVIALTVEGLDVFIDIPVKSGENFRIHSRYSLRRLQKSFPVGIFTDRLKDIPHSILDLREIHIKAALLGYRIVICVIVHLSLLQVQRYFFLYSIGVMPICFLNATLNLCGDENPDCKDIAETFISLFWRSLQAFSILFFMR